MKCSCRSVNSWQGPTSRALRDFATLDYYDGIVTAVGSCSTCSVPYVVSLVSWRPSESRLRIYGVSEITPAWFSTARDRLLARQRSVAHGESHFTDQYEEAIATLLASAPKP